VMMLLTEFQVVMGERRRSTMGSRWGTGDRRPTAILSWRSSLGGRFQQGEEGGS